MKKTVKLFLGVWLALLSFSALAEAAPRCDTIWKISKLAALKAYGAEVRETKGLSLVVRPAKESDRPYSGVWTPKNQSDVLFPRLHQVFQAIPAHVFENLGRDYDFTLFSAISYSLLDRPAHFISERGFNKKYELSVVSKMLATTVFFVAANPLVQKIFTHAVDKHVDSLAMNYALELGPMIENDYRFDAIKEDLAAHRISNQEAMTLAYSLQLGYQEYYRFIANLKSDPTAPQNIEILRHHILFQNIDHLMVEGVSTDRDFREVVSRRALSSAEVGELFRLQHQLYFRYQVLSDAYLFGKTDEQFRDYLRITRLDPFTKLLVQKMERGQISRARLTDLLQEDAFWQMKFKFWRTLGLHRLKRDAQGRLTNDDLTNDDIRIETLANLPG